MRFWVPRRERAAWLLGAARAGRGLAGVAAVAATAVAVLVPAQLGTGSQGNAASTATAASSPPAAVMGGREIVGGLGGIVGGDSLLIT
jgi:hypothetical protein